MRDRDGRGLRPGDPVALLRGEGGTWRGAIFAGTRGGLALVRLAGRDGIGRAFAVPPARIVSRAGRHLRPVEIRLLPAMRAALEAARGVEGPAVPPLVSGQTLAALRRAGLVEEGGRRLTVAGRAEAARLRAAAPR